MLRMSWSNNRICRWPDGGLSSGPSKEEKLRKKYPELQEKWDKYIDCDEIYDNMMMQELDRSGDTDTTDTEWKVASDNAEKAKNDYEFLLKMLQDY